MQPHFWSPDNPHPEQAEAEMKDGPVIRTFGNSGGSKRRYLKDGDVILPTGLSTVFDVMTRAEIDARYEPME